jgi:cytidylate kinase
LHWNFWEVGKLDEELYKQLKRSEVDVQARPDSIDIEREEKIKTMLVNDSHTIIQSHLAGFDAQGIPNVYKILVICEDAKGNDIPEIRIKRLVERKGISIEDAENEVKKREKGLLEKWSRLYANNDEAWVYWDKKYYDLIINNSFIYKEECLQKALKAIGYKKEN